MNYGKIEWPDKYSVSHPELDDQHKRLIVLVNQLLDAPSLSVSSEAVSDAISKIIEHTEQHFQTEEQFISQIDYPELAEHKESHSILLSEVAHIRLDIMNRQEGAPQHLLHYLMKRIDNHILKEDMKYRDYCEECGIL